MAVFRQKGQYISAANQKACEIFLFQITRVVVKKSF